MNSLSYILCNISPDQKNDIKSKILSLLSSNLRHITLPGGIQLDLKYNSSDDAFNKSDEKINQQFDDIFKDTNQSFDDIFKGEDKEFESIDKDFEEFDKNDTNFGEDTQLSKQLSEQQFNEKPMDSKHNRSAVILHNDPSFDWEQHKNDRTMPNDHFLEGLKVNWDFTKSIDKPGQQFDKFYNNDETINQSLVEHQERQIHSILEHLKELDRNLSKFRENIFRDTEHNFTIDLNDTFGNDLDKDDYRDEIYLSSNKESNNDSEINLGNNIKIDFNFNSNNNRTDHQFDENDDNIDKEFEDIDKELSHFDSEDGLSVNSSDQHLFDNFDEQFDNEFSEKIGSETEFNLNSIQQVFQKILDFIPFGKSSETNDKSFDKSVVIKKPGIDLNMKYSGPYLKTMTRNGIESDSKRPDGKGIKRIGS